jgi:hypothetical protein
VSKFFGVSVSSVLRRLAGVSLVSVVGLGGVAGAQNVPTLVPYTVKLIAGGATSNTAAGGKCPSGLKATDAYGDGCLATEVLLGTSAAGSGPRYAVADKTGAVFFSDWANGLIRRVDPITGVVTAVAGGATKSPTSGTACGAYTSTDIKGDGCLSTAVLLSNPTGLAFAPNGDLYFAEYGYSDVRKIAATNGVVTTGGVISLVAGSSTSITASTQHGYTSSNATTTINAATQSLLYYPFGLAFDAKGDLYISDEYKDAILVVNTNTSGSNTVTGVTIPAGAITKIAGASLTGGATCPNSPATTYGCSYGNYTTAVSANSSYLDSPWGVAVDPTGNVYIANEFNNDAAAVNNSTGILTNFAGIYPPSSTGAKKLVRAQAGTFAIGSDFGVATDSAADVYLSDALNGVVWRVDAGTNAMYVVAGGASTVCTGTADTYGDGCIATQAKFGSSGTSYSASGITGNAGVYGVSVDSQYNLFTGDTVTNTIREVASGAAFGVIGANQPTQTLDVHFAVGDGPTASTPYVLTAGATNFSLGKASCTTNSDNTMDCLLPVTATPTTLGAFTGTLTVTSTQGATNAFTLSGTYAQSPATRTVVTFSAPSVTCTGTTTYSTTTPIAITATITANGPAAPGGTVQFYANGAPIGTPQSVAVGGTSSVPVYTASLTYTFSTPNTYTLTAVYSGDSYFMTSTSTGTNVTSSSPTFAASAISYQESSVVAGGTALYSFNVAQNVYAGTITFACSGLPANAACSFSPSTVTANGCSTGTTVALSITTAQGNVTTSGFGGFGNGPWQLVAMFPAVGLALLIGLRRRKAGMRYGQIWMGLALLIGLSSLMACTGSKLNAPLTPSGTSTVTVTATGSAGTTSSFTVPLTVK